MADSGRTAVCVRPFDRLRVNGLGVGALADLGEGQSSRWSMAGFRALRVLVTPGICAEV